MCSSTLINLSTNVRDVVVVILREIRHTHKYARARSLSFLFFRYVCQKIAKRIIYIFLLFSWHSSHVFQSVTCVSFEIWYLDSEYQTVKTDMIYCWGFILKNIDSFSTFCFSFTTSLWKKENVFVRHNNTEKKFFINVKKNSILRVIIYSHIWERLNLLYNFYVYNNLLVLR